MEARSRSCRTHRPHRDPGAWCRRRLCSAGLDKYGAFDEPGEWNATEVDNDFTLTFTSTAPHETEFYRIYVTEQGFDPTTDELTWNDLELVHETGQLPAAPTDVFEVSAPGRSGHHVVYLQWRRLPGHSPETFHSCSDVIFPDGDGGGEQPAPEEPAEQEPAPDDLVDEDPAPRVPAEPSTPEPDAEGPAVEEPVAEVPVGDAGSGLSGIFEWLLALLNNLLATFSF